MTTPPFSPSAYDLIAAVDLGSNSFRVETGRVVGNQIYPLDGLKETVRLAAGLTPEKLLDEAAQTRGLATLERFGEMLRGFAPRSVRAVATNTLRVAKNAGQFLDKAEKALGFPIEVIAGREEARLIFLGVSHTLPEPSRRQLVMDIGGGSTELIIGSNFKPLLLESLYMGCVGYSRQFFADSKVTKKRMKEAELAARRELQAIVHAYRDAGWEEAVGSSGTAKSIVDLLETNGLNPPNVTGISREGLERLRELLFTAGSAENLPLQGLRAERVPVLPGGLAIMLAVFREFGLARMVFSEGALRQGVLYDLLGRNHREDLREATVTNFMRRYEIDTPQAARVARTARRLLTALRPPQTEEERSQMQFLDWAARLHETGIALAHSSYHRHSAYILENADMPGFSRRDQAQLARLVLGHRGKLERVLLTHPTSADWPLIFALRTAALLHRSRDEAVDPPVSARITGKGFQLTVDAAWLMAAPLTATALSDEIRHWSALGIRLTLVRRHD